VKPSFCHAMFALVLLGGVGAASAQIGSTPPSIQDGTIGRGEVNPTQWRLTEAQRSAIAAAVRRDNKAAEPSISFVPSVGAPVPPAIELYMLPDAILAEVPAAKLVKYTVVKNQLILIDPTNMRVVEIITQ